jgi:protein-disulfide isomerase
MSDKKRTSKSEKLASVKGKNINTLSVIASFALGILIGYFIWGFEASAPKVLEVNDAPAAGEVRRVDVPTEGFPFEGPVDAPIVIVEFSDFQCPFCTKWHNETYKPLLEEYPDQIKLVYRNFPLTSIHPDAYLSAEAAMCAGDQNRYWDYHEMLFEGIYGLSEDALRKYAEELDLDMATFNNCLDSQTYKQFVRDDMDYAASIGVQSTPTFYVNGTLIVGAQPIQVFRSVIDDELANN